jgi:uncharacterized protein YqjF (DUF2071 family)
MASELTFRLHVEREAAMKYYQGKAQAVITRADNGQTLRFPAIHIRRFIDQNGIHGHFLIRFDAKHKLVDLQRIGD